MPIRRPARTLLLLACCASLFSGCATFGGSVGDLLGPEPEVSKSDAPLPQDGPSFVVEVQPDGKSKKTYKRPLPEDGTYVGQVLEQSNALKRFGRVTLELWRPLPNGAGYHKLDIPFDRKQKAVPPGYDYAIHPDDRLVIIEDSSTLLDDMLGSITGPVSAVIR